MTQSSRALFLALAALPFAAHTQAQSAASLNTQTKQFVSVDAPVIALTHARVIDGTGAAPANDQTIVIDNGKIAAVGPSATTKSPAGAKVIDLTGSIVLPGFVGMHDHTFYTTSNRSVQQNTSAPRLYLATGVTTIRTTGSNYPYAEINLKKVIDKGQAPGPRMIVTGPYMKGENQSVSMVNFSSAADARRAVGYWADEGVTWFKFYTGISREEAKAAIDEAHKRGMKVTGHLCSLGFKEAVELGIDGLEHGLITNSEYDPAKVADTCPPGVAASLKTLDVKGDAARQTIKTIVDHKVPMTSTLAVFELFVPNRPPLEQRMFDAMSPETRTEYLTSRARISENNALGIPLEVFKKAMQFEYDFSKAGGLLAAGVDPTGNGGALPGFGDQRNYELFLEAGFTPVEAVQIMSANGAKVLGMYDQIGSVEVGKKADLMVIHGDPVAKPAEIRNVTTVFKDGVGYDSQKLLDSVRGLVGVR
jgi:imidazolonepropionase-like amidohydrolase